MAQERQSHPLGANAVEYDGGPSVFVTNAEGSTSRISRFRFLRLLTKSQTSDSPMTLGKWFLGYLLVDGKGLEFYHRHREFLRMLGQNPPSAISFEINQLA